MRVTRCCVLGYEGDQVLCAGLLSAHCSLRLRCEGNIVYSRPSLPHATASKLCGWNLRCTMSFYIDKGGCVQQTVKFWCF